MLKKTFAATVAIALGTSTAGAATLSVVGGTDALLPENFSLDRSLFGSEGDLSLFTGDTKTASGGLFIDGPSLVTFTFLGSEAGATNEAIFTGSSTETTLFNTSSTTGAVSSSFQVDSGFLPFRFATNLSGGQTIANDGTATSMGLSLAIALLGPSAALVLFDDGPADGDLDDLGMLVEVSEVAAVPLPAPIFLLGLSIAGLGMFGARRPSRV